VGRGGECSHFAPTRACDGRQVATAEPMSGALATAAGCPNATQVPAVRTPVVGRVAHRSVTDCVISTDTDNQTNN
jgi:hypothetical protein